MPKKYVESISLSSSSKIYKKLMMYKKRLRQLSLFTLKLWRLRESTSVLYYLEKVKEKTLRLFSEAHNNNNKKEARGKAATEKIWTEYKVKFFTVRAIEHWNKNTDRLQSSSWKILRTHLDKALAMKSEVLWVVGHQMTHRDFSQFKCFYYFITIFNIVETKPQD